VHVSAHPAQASPKGCPAGPKPYPRRREDPLPQTPYVLLGGPPTNGVPVQGFVLRSVHHADIGHRGLRPVSRLRRHGVQLALRFRLRCQCFHTGSPGPRQHPFGSGHYVPYPASYPQGRRRRGRPTRPEVSCCLSATGIGFSGHPLPARGLGLPHGRLTGHRPRTRTLTGLPRSTHARCGRGGCLLYPEGDGTHPADKKSSTGACRSSAAQPLHPAQTTHQRGSHITKHQRRFTRFTRPALP